MHPGIHIDGEVDADIVSSLEQFLVMAKAGKLRNLAIAAIDGDMCAQTVYAHKGRSVLTLCGSLGMLTRQIERSHVDE